MKSDMQIAVEKLKRSLRIPNIKNPFKKED